MSLTNQKILIVDDDMQILKLVKSILSKAEYNVTTCTDGNVALDKMNEEPFDCIITDAVMPALNGFDFVRRIRQDPLSNKIPVLMLTRKREREAVEEALEAGVNDYLLKPIDQHILLKKINLFLHARSEKRTVYEAQILTHQSESELAFHCSIHKISESDVVLYSAIPFPENMYCELKAPLFQEIGINAPLVKLIQCQPNTEARVSLKTKYLGIFSLAGVPEKDLMKLRSWLFRESIKKNKQALETKRRT